MVREATADDIEDIVRLVMEYYEFYGVKIRMWTRCAKEKNHPVFA